jgi:hypothetical protein
MEPKRRLSGQNGWGGDGAARSAILPEDAVSLGSARAKLAAVLSIDLVEAAVKRWLLSFEFPALSAGNGPS